MPVTGAPPPAALTHTLYFIRHGETDWNAEARLQGQRDVPLNDFGRVQAEEVGARLRGLLLHYEDLDYVASPLSRHRETMERMRRRSRSIPLPTASTSGCANSRSASGRASPGKRSASAIRAAPAPATPTSGASCRRKAKATPCSPGASRRSSPISPATRSWSRMAVSPARSSRSSATPRPTRRRGSTSGRGGCWCSRAPGTTGPKPCGDRRHSRPVQRFGRHARNASSSALRQRMRPPAGPIPDLGGRGGTARRQGSPARRRRGPGVCEAARQPTPAGAEHWMNKPAESTRFRVEAAREAAILRGDIRDDLIRDEVLADLFAATARARPDHPALVFGETRHSYGEVDARSDAIAGGLIERGIGPGDVVGLWMGRGPELLIAQIAIAKSGAAWLPFDADAPVDRIAVCLADGGAKGLVTSAALVSKAEVGCPVLASAELARTGGGAPVDPKARGLNPDHPAYLIYTSGSTGTPKGIVVTHRNICHFLRASNALYGFTAADVVFQGASVAFDLSMEEIWIPYMVGATLVVASPATIGDAEKLPDILVGAGVTVLDTVPTLLGLLNRDIPCVRLILLGGEALPPPLVSRWSKPGRRLFNTYGPTEATVVATACELRAGEPVTIGRPIPNYSTYVADENLNLLPPGVQGELLIGGPGIAKGYLKRPELTAEKFIANPFPSDGRDPILYRSGDAVSLDEAGNIAFHGRIDDQVKIRGFRVELGEIETKLVHLPGVAQAAVVLRQDEGMDRLVAFLVLEAGVALDRATIRADLRDELPPYMIPSHFEIVEALPRLSSGKVDRKSLKMAELAVGDAPGEQEEPANETEAALLVAAKRVFGNQAIPFTADFFTDLGGHSLLAARFVSNVREVPVLASITLQDVYGKRSLRAMADDLIEKTGGAGAAHVARDLSFTPPPLMRRFLCGLAQAAALPVILTLNTMQWLGIFVTYLLLAGEGLGFLAQMAALLAVYVVINAVTALTAIALKWVVLGRTKPGRYPLWGAYYFRWWFVKRLEPLVHIKWLQGSPMIRRYLRLMGAQVGGDVIIADIDAGAIDLVSIGGGTTMGSKTKIANVEIIGNEMVIGP